MENPALTETTYYILLSLYHPCLLYTSDAADEL